MRDVFVKTVQDDRVSVREGTFDTTNIDDGWADLVVIAQAGNLLVVLNLPSHSDLYRHSIGARTMMLLPLSWPES